MTRVLSSIPSYQEWRRSVPSGRSVGFVPTMGGLHAGHFALARRALQECDEVVVSIYLNRTQFNNAEDFEKYPANFEDDRLALEAMGVSAIFAPSYQEMYPDDYRYRVTEEVFSKELEGEHRPGHFDGVLTVVLKLLQIAQAGRAYFGEKDWQQLHLVKGMVEAFFLPVEIVACPTERAESGLALSSRNRRLSEEGLRIAPRFNRILNTADSDEAAASELKDAGFEVEYVADREDRRLGAVILEGVRLIDNVALAGRVD